MKAAAFRFSKIPSSSTGSLSWQTLPQAPSAALWVDLYRNQHPQTRDQLDPHAPAHNARQDRRKGSPSLRSQVACSSSCWRRWSPWPRRRESLA